MTCYEEKLLDWYTNYGSTTEVDDVLDGSTYPAFQAWQLEMLMKWAKNDPVSEKETARNNAVYSIQNNRNPFIDYPGLEEYIWGTMTTTAFSYDNYVQPVYKQDVAMSFSLTEATATLGVDFTEPTLTTDPDGLTVAYSSSDTDVATVDASTGAVTLVAAGTTTITATFAGDDSYNEGSAQYTLTVSDPSLVAGETLLYEGLTGYTSSGDATNDMAKDNANLNYRSWSSFTKIFAGGINNAYSNGGCLKFGSGSATGSMTTGNISLTGGGTLTFYLKQYGSDTGKLNVTVTGATADVTQFAPSSTWTLCTVNLTGATGTVTITLATSSKRAYVDEITLTSNGKLYLANDGNNANAIAAAATNGGKYDVTLSDRTLYKDGSWNTLALPFALSAAQIAASDLAEADIRTLSTASFSDGTLTLNFTPETGEGAVTEIAAGTPYIIKWASNSTNIVNPVFSGVTIDETVRNKECELGDGVSVTFCGTYEMLAYDDDDPSVLFLGSQNTLYYPVASASIGAQRAYFYLAGITAKASAPGDGSGNSPVRSFVLNFGDEASGISATLNDNAEMTNDRWYTLDGRRLNGRPTTKGLYIHGGRKVLIK